MGEGAPTRRGNLHGLDTRDVVTTTGRMEDLNVPRDREGVFQTQAFERSQRSEPEVAEALTPLARSGVSTHDIGKGRETLIGGAPRASAVSRLNAPVTGQEETWRERPLLDHSRVVYLDGVHVINAGGQTPISQSADDALRRPLLTMKTPLFFPLSRAQGLAQRASQAVSRGSEAALLPPGKSATLAHALDAQLLTTPAIFGQK